MEDSKKIYLGRGKYLFDGAAFSFSMNMSRLKQEAEYLKENEHLLEFKGSNFLKFKVTPLRDGADQNGKTHKVEVDLWKPDSNKTFESKTSNQFDERPMGDVGRDEPEEDIPF